MTKLAFLQFGVWHKMYCNIMILLILINSACTLLWEWLFWPLNVNQAMWSRYDP